MSSSHGKVVRGNSHLKSTRVSSQNKLARDLRSDFDQYALIENENESLEEISELNHRSQLNSQQNISYDTNQKSFNEKRKSFSRSRNTHTKNREKENENFNLPKSYILAMEHLQDVVQEKQAQIDDLRNELLEKQSSMLESESRINEVLQKYQVLIDICSKKDNEVVFLKQQIQELRLDKQKALKQVSRAFEQELKAEDNEQRTLKQRSMSTNSYKIHHQTSTNKKQVNIDHLESLGKSRQSWLQKSRQMPAQIYLDSKLTFEGKEKNRDFISYQREIIRNQKQLIALKYRMECLERKLESEPKTESVKKKIRTLSQEIEAKERSINNLKKV